MALQFVTFLLVIFALGHLWLQLFNRVLLILEDGPRKRTWQELSLALIVGMPAALLVIFSGSRAVSEALSWNPSHWDSRLLFGAFGALWLIGVWRGWLWACDRVMPSRSRRLLRQTVATPPMPRARGRLPVLLRPLETTCNLEIVEREIEVPSLAADFDGLTIALVSDLHYDPRHGQRAVSASIAAHVQRLVPHVVVFTGDFINDGKLIERSVAFHATMRGRLATLCVLGNHDYWTDPDAVRDACLRRAIRPLGGERWTIERGGRRLHFVGTDAPWNHERPDWRRLLEKKPGDAVILLSHTPDNAPAAARRGANLILSGHTHGGQYCFPFVGPVVVPSRYGHRFTHGVYDVGPETVLCVSRGLGTSDAGTRRGGGRMLCPMELVLITLRAPGVEATARATERRARRIAASVSATQGT